MARRRYRKRDDGLIAIALRSDWKVSAALAAGSLFVGIVLVPAYLGSNPMLRPIAGVFTPFASVLAFAFACIAFVRYFKRAPARLAATAIHRQAHSPRRDGRNRPPAGSLTEPTEAMMDSAPAPSTTTPVEATRPTATAKPQLPESWSPDGLDRVEWK